MLWLFTLHISSLTFWCAAQLYIPALVVGSSKNIKMLEAPEHWESTARFVFTYISTPAALLTIIAGTGIFLVNRTVEPWLFIKLFAVVALVCIHAMMGAIVLRSDRDSPKPVLFWSALLTALFILCIAIILWLVLAKPYAGAAPMVIS